MIAIKTVNWIHCTLIYHHLSFIAHRWSSRHFFFQNSRKIHQPNTITMKMKSIFFIMLIAIPGCWIRVLNCHSDADKLYKRILFKLENVNWTLLCDFELMKYRRLVKRQISMVLFFTYFISVQKCDKLLSCIQRHGERDWVFYTSMQLIKKNHGIYYDFDMQFFLFTSF